MEVRGKRKFIAFLISIGLFFIILSFVIFFIMPMPSAATEINALGVFSGMLGAAIMIISGAFYAGNAAVHKVTNNHANENTN